MESFDFSCLGPGLGHEPLETGWSWIWLLCHVASQCSGLHLKSQFQF